MTMEFSIGALAERTGCNVQTIRWYEQTGLLPAAGRSSGNQRRYGPPHLRRLGFIRHARELGFPLDSIRELLALVDRPAVTCDAVHAIAAGHRAAVRSRIERLQALDRELERMVEECAAGRVGACHVIEVLADHTHSHCLDAGHGAGPEPSPLGELSAGRPAG